MQIKNTFRLGSLLTQYKDSISRMRSPLLQYPQQGAPFSVTQPILKVESGDERKKKDYAIDQLAKWLKKTRPGIYKQAVAATNAQFKGKPVNGLGETTAEPSWFDSLLDNIAKVTNIKSTVELNKASTDLEKARVQAEIRTLQTNINRAQDAQPPINYPAPVGMDQIKVPLIVTAVAIIAKKVFS